MALRILSEYAQGLPVQYGRRHRGIDPDFRKFDRALKTPVRPVLLPLQRLPFRDFTAEEFLGRTLTTVPRRRRLHCSLNNSSCIPRVALVDARCSDWDPCQRTGLVSCSGPVGVLKHGADRPLLGSHNEVESLM